MSFSRIVAPLVVPAFMAAETGCVHRIDAEPLAQETRTQRTQLSDVVASFGLDAQEQAAVAGKTCDWVQEYPDGVVCTVNQSYSEDPGWAAFEKAQKKDGRPEYVSIGENSSTTGDQVVSKEMGMSRCTDEGKTVCSKFGSARITVLKPEVDESMIGEVQPEISIGAGYGQVGMLDATNDALSNVIFEATQTTNVMTARISGEGAFDCAEGATWNYEGMSDPETLQRAFPRLMHERSTLNVVMNPEIVDITPPASSGNLATPVLLMTGDLTEYLTYQEVGGLRDTLNGYHRAMAGCLDGDPAKKEKALKEGTRLISIVMDTSTTARE